jgi:gluconate 5-dehydrogenase
MSKWNLADLPSQSNRTIIVTGANSGLGRATTAALAGAGARVVMAVRDTERGRATADSISGTTEVRELDLADLASVRRFAAEWEGPIDVLVNNAGVQHRVPMLDLELADWRRVIDVDLTSAFIVGRAVARGMVERRRGKIVNIGSVQSELARATIAPYTSAKGGLRNLTRAMAAEWGAANVQANSIAPGYIHTEMTQNLVDDEDFNAWVLGRTPAARWGSCADLVGPTIWLASDASGYVNGQTIFVDGGMTAVV